MVGAPYVHHVVEPARELVDDVGAVRAEVRVRAVGPHDHAVLVVAEGGRSEPGGAVGVVGVVGGAQPLHRRRDLALALELGLGEVDVEPHAEPLEGALHPGEDATGALGEQPSLALGFGQVGEGVAVLGHDVASDLDHVLTVVAVLRQLRVPAQHLEVARHHRGAEQVHLAAGVVEVVLALDRLAGGLEQAGERVAQRGVAGMPDMERPRGVGAHELDLDPSSRGFGAAVGLAEVGDRSQRVVQPRVGREDVEEPRPRHLHLLDQRRGGQRVGDRLRHVARRAAGPLGERERHVGGEVPVTLLLGSQQLGRGQVALDAQLGGRRAQALLEPVDELRFDHEGFPRPIAVCTALTSNSGSNGFVT